MSKDNPPMDEEDLIERLQEENEELRNEVMEQCRINGIGANREHRLMTQLDEAKRKIEDLTTWTNYWKNKAHDLQKAVDSI